MHNGPNIFGILFPFYRASLTKLNLNTSTRELIAINQTLTVSEVRAPRNPSLYFQNFYYSTGSAINYY